MSLGQELTAGRVYVRKRVSGKEKKEVRIWEGVGSGCGCASVRNDLRLRASAIERVGRPYFLGKEENYLVDRSVFVWITTYNIIMVCCVNRGGRT